MKRAILLATALAAFLGFALPARQADASVSVGVSIGTGRHGGFSLSFASRPNVVLIPSSRVYYAPDLDEDLYAYGDDWYYCDEGNWYTGPSYDGPFVQVAFTSVPYEIRNVPVSYRRHWGGYAGYNNAPVYRAPVTTRYRTQVQGNTSRTWSDQRRNWNDQNQNRTQNDGNRTWSGRDQQWNNQNRAQNDGNRTWSGRDQQWNNQNPRGGQNDHGQNQGQNGRGNGHGRGRGNGNGHGNGHGNGWGGNS